MTMDRDQLIAYVATLLTLVVVFVSALVAAAIHPEMISKLDVFGMGTITGGLIGTLRVPSQRSVTVDNKPGDPVPTVDALPEPAGPARDPAAIASAPSPEPAAPTP